MKKLTHWIALAAALAVGPAARAADHADGTAGVGMALDPAADINDLFAWMSADASTVNLAITVFPGATTASSFSDVVKYVFHVGSVSAYMGAETKRDLICTFAGGSATTASCWLTDPGDKSVKEYVTGNASAATGVASADGKVKVFAGLRDDPFFFNLAGFRNATSTVALALKDFVAAPSHVGTYIKGLDATHGNCPILSSAARTVVGTYVQKDCTGAGTAVDFFKKPVDAENGVCTTKPALVNSQQTKNSGLTGNVLALVVTVDKTLLTGGGPVLNVWAATTR